MSSLSESALKIISRTWKALGLHTTPLVTIADRLTAAHIPFGLSFTYGTLYGWSIREALHNPEPETVAFFQKRLKHGDRVADIGANIGYYTLIFSQLVGDSGKVVAFEPSPHAYACLMKAVSGKTNVDVVQKGVYSDSRTLNLYSERAGSGGASVAYRAGGGRYYTAIPLIPLRDYPATFTWAKIDVEGAEIEVLRGMREPIRCVLEVAKEIQEQYGGGVLNFLRDIEMLGYHVSFIIKNGDVIPWNGSNIDCLVANIYVEPVALLRN